MKDSVYFVPRRGLWSTQIPLSPKPFASSVWDQAEDQESLVLGTGRSSLLVLPG